MISIVICARTPEINPRLAENIRTTIGCEHELVVIDNSENRHTIFTAYNLGIDRSQGELICFMHDDILLHTQNWGQHVEDIFRKHPSAGLLGVSGGKMKTRIPSAWWNCPAGMHVIQILQHKPSGEVLNVNLGFEQSGLPEVVTIDGVYMVLRRSTGVRMNTALTGFHCYDISLSIECRKRGFRVFVTNKILLEHFSQGTINKSWFDATFQLHKIYKRDLPMTLPGHDDPKLVAAAEFKNGMKIITLLQQANYRRGSTFLVWLQMVRIKPLSWIHLWYLKNLVRSFWRTSEPSNVENQS